MNKTEKTAFRESIIVVLMGLVINFPLQTFLLWLTIDIWDWRNTLMISIFTQLIITFVEIKLVRLIIYKKKFILSLFNENS